MTANICDVMGAQGDDDKERRRSDRPESCFIEQHCLPKFKDLVETLIDNLSRYLGETTAKKIKNFSPLPAPAPALSSNKWFYGELKTLSTLSPSDNSSEICILLFITRAPGDRHEDVDTRARADAGVDQPVAGVVVAAADHHRAAGIRPDTRSHKEPLSRR